MNRFKRPDSSQSYQAPGGSGYASMVLPGANQSDMPPVDEYAVEPETREELIDGQRVHVLPAAPPHGDRHFELDYVLRAAVAPGYVGSTDLLTRTSERWNFAADASVRKQGTDPATGRRYLEELAFEVKHTQSMKDITERARQLVGRGVRRVFAICVSSRGEHLVQVGPVMEWSDGDDRWIELDADAVIEDPCLRCPLEVRALLDATEADNSVARALLARGNAVLEQAQASAAARGHQQGRTQALRQAILDMCELLDIELTPARREQLETLDGDGLHALRTHIKRHRRWDDAPVRPTVEGGG